MPSELVPKTNSTLPGSGKRGSENVNKHDTKTKCKWTPKQCLDIFL